MCAKAVTSHLSLQCQTQVWIAFTSKAKVPPALALVFDMVGSLCAPPNLPPDLTRQERDDTRSTHLPSVPWAGASHEPGQVPRLSLTHSSLEWLVSSAWAHHGHVKLKIPVFGVLYAVC